MKYTIVKYSEIAKEPTMRLDAKYWIKKKEECMKRGHWEIKFKFWVEGRDDVFDLEDLSEISQEHIINLIKQGYTSGELNEPDIQSDTQRKIQREKDRSKRSSKSDV